jgi:hypothetical protein
MTTRTALIIIAGRTQRITVTDDLAVGFGVKALGNTNLTLSPGGTATDVVVLSGKNLVPGGDNTGSFGSSTLRWADVNATQVVARADATDTSKSTLLAASLTGRSDGAFTVQSGASQALTITGNAASTWSTSSGLLTIDGAGGTDFQGGSTSALQINSAGTAITVQPGAVLGTTGTGNINLPSNGTTRFQIEGVAVTDSNITAANFDKLFDGSDVGALHTHAGLAASDLTETGVTTNTGGTTLDSLGSGYFAFVSGANALQPTDADTEAEARCFGLYTVTTGTVKTAGVGTVAMTTTGGDPGNGGPVYLAPASEEANALGKGTATSPDGPSQWSAEVGLCLDNGNYAGSKTVEMLLQVKTVVGV